MRAAFEYTGMVVCGSRVVTREMASVKIMTLLGPATPPLCHILSV